MRRSWILLWSACAGPVDPADDSDGAPDLTVRLGAGEVRGGVVVDPSSLPEGMASEGRIGDFILYNSEARFILQGMRDGSYYVTGWGGILDADVIREEGKPGRDIVEKWLPMLGVGRVLTPDRIEVVDDGTQGGAAVLRVVGTDVPLALIEGAAESPGLLPPFGLQVEQTYTLRPDTPFLEVQTTVTAPEAVSLEISDVLFGSPETSAHYTEGAGLTVEAPERYGWTGSVGSEHDVAVAMFSEQPDGLRAGSLELLTGLADLAVGGTPKQELAAGQAWTWSRTFGVGRTLADLTDRWLDDQEQPAQTVEGTVQAPDGPVPGAWVHVLVDGAPWTLARTGDDGTFAAKAPAGSEVAAIAVGERTGLVVDRPEAPLYAPYAEAAVRERTLAAVARDEPRRASVEARGVGSPGDPLALAEPAQITVTVDDGRPFSVLLRPLGGARAFDEVLVDRRIGGLSSAGWSRGGPLTLSVPEGRHQLVVHRGIRHEVFEETLDVEAGERVARDVALAEAYKTPDWVLADPHAHASPSGDGQIPMEDRLIVAAASGLDVHVGTDHDHLADYRPLVAALGLDDVMVSVVADEVSPPLRGHMNIYPVASDPAASNGGAWSWWDDIPTSTEGIIDTLRARHGDGMVIQLNHPPKQGVPSSAGWSPGRIRQGNRWTERFQAVEVLNSGDPEGLSFFLDVINRGLRATPTGVSDSHTHLSGHIGHSSTFVYLPDSVLSDFDPDAFGQAVRAGHTVPTRGPFLEVSSLPGSDLAAGTTLTVTARAPSWIQVDRILLLENGEEAQRVEGSTASFTLSPDEDAVYVVIAEGDAAMWPVTDKTPWALAGPWRVDGDGGGWTAPLPPLQVDD